MDGGDFNAVAEIFNREEERSYTEDFKKNNPIFLHLISYMLLDRYTN